MRIDLTGKRIDGFPHRTIRAFVEQCWSELEKAGVTRPADDVSIYFTNDTEMQELNRTWRSSDRTTDVLTFTAAEDALPDEAEHSLGDIVISVDQAERQAQDQEHSLAVEIRYLILHGLIHALGYDHETDGGEMNDLEMTIRSRVDLD